MKRDIIIISTVIISIISVLGCAKKQDANNRIIARVSSQVITEKDLKAKIAKLPPYYQNIISRDPKRYIEDIIVEMLFYEDGIRKGIDRDKEVNEVVKEAKKKIVIAKLIKNEVEDKVSVTEDEIRQSYEERKNEFKTPEMWRASHILVGDRKEAMEVLDELARGGNFEELAKKHSIDATADRGGDVGFFRQGQLVPDFEKAALKLEKGQTSGIVETQFGYHIIKLTDKKESGIQTYEEARRAVEADLKKKKRSELFNALVLSLKNKYGVEVNEAAFPEKTE